MIQLIGPLLLCVFIGLCLYVAASPSRGSYYPPGTVLYTRRCGKWERVTVEESKFKGGLWYVKTEGKGFRPACFYHLEKPNYTRK